MKKILLTASMGHDWNNSDSASVTRDSAIASLLSEIERDDELTERVKKLMPKLKKSSSFEYLHSSCECYPNYVSWGCGGSVDLQGLTFTVEDDSLYINGDLVFSTNKEYEQAEETKKARKKAEEELERHERLEKAARSRWFRKHCGPEGTWFCPPHQRFYDYSKKECRYWEGDPGDDTAVHLISTVCDSLHLFRTSDKQEREIIARLWLEEDAKKSDKSVTTRVSDRLSKELNKKIETVDFYRLMTYEQYRYLPVVPGDIARTESGKLCRVGLVHCVNFEPEEATVCWGEGDEAAAQGNGTCRLYYSQLTTIFRPKIVLNGGACFSCGCVQNEFTELS